MPAPKIQGHQTQSSNCDERWVDYEKDAVHIIRETVGSVLGNTAYDQHGGYNRHVVSRITTQCLRYTGKNERFEMMFPEGLALKYLGSTFLKA